MLQHSTREKGQSDLNAVNYEIFLNFSYPLSGLPTGCCCGVVGYRNIAFLPQCKNLTVLQKCQGQTQGKLKNGFPNG